MSASKLRWGILGTAQIARKNWKAIQLSGNSTVVAVASRDAERARRFIAECQAQAPMEAVPKAIGSYEELLASESVDAVYIPLPIDQSLGLIWPHITTLFGLVAVCFGISYIIFMRAEIRA